MSLRGTHPCPKTVRQLHELSVDPTQKPVQRRQAHLLSTSWFLCIPQNQVCTRTPMHAAHARSSGRALQASGQPFVWPFPSAATAMFLVTSHLPDVPMFHHLCTLLASSPSPTKSILRLRAIKFGSYVLLNPFHNYVQEPCCSACPPRRPGHLLLLACSGLTAVETSQCATAPMS